MRFPQFNEILADAECFGEERLRRFLVQLCQEHSVFINFHDVAGVSKMSDPMQDVLAPYLYHNNSFCNFLKKFDSTTKTCAINKRLLCRRLSRNPSAYYDMCYMGIEELRYPVLWQGRLIACLCVGQFCSDQDAAQKRLKVRAVQHNLPLSEAAAHFNSCTRPLSLDIAKLTTQINILSQLVSVLYDRFVRTSANRGAAILSAEHHKQSFLVSRTLEYIDEHLSQALSLKTLANICYCSESYLSAVFKKKTGQSLMGCIRTKRVARAKALLDLSNLSITEIAWECGFLDSNYFSRVFSQSEGISPTQYRRRR